MFNVGDKVRIITNTLPDEYPDYDQLIGEKCTILEIEDNGTYAIKVNVGPDDEDYSWWKEEELELIQPAQIINLYF